MDAQTSTNGVAINYTPHRPHPRRSSKLLLIQDSQSHVGELYWFPEAVGIVMSEILEENDAGLVGLGSDVHRGRIQAERFPAAFSVNIRRRQC